MAQNVECCICFENIGTKNNCTTPCGHQFCFTCVSKCLSQNNTCPCCRTVLMEIDEDEDDDDEESDYSDTDTDYSLEEDDNMDSITMQFLGAGYTTNDIVTMLIGRVKERNEKYTSGYIKKMYDDFNKILRDSEAQRHERDMFAAEDKKISESP